MTAPAATIRGRMLCASALTYSIPHTPLVINPPNTNIPQTDPFYGGAGYTSPPTMIQNGKAACTIGVNQDGIVLAFRGTVYNSPSDWLHDLLIITKEGTNLPGRVHTGFYDQFTDIAAEITSTIQALLSNDSSLNLIITGHSKGAGMAPIAAYYLSANSNITASQVYLYAPPNCGNTDFAAGYNQLFPNTYLFENNQDIVPLLPPTPITAGSLAGYFTLKHPLIDAALLAMALEGYSPVGIDSNTFFIEAPVNGTFPIVAMSNSVATQQLNAIEAVLSAEDFSVFVKAHSTACGQDYMYALCPEVPCPLTNS